MLKDYIKNRQEITKRKIIDDNKIVLTTSGGLQLLVYLTEFNVKNLFAKCDVLQTN